MNNILSQIYKSTEATNKTVVSIDSTMQKLLKLETLEYKKEQKERSDKDKKRRREGQLASRKAGDKKGLFGALSKKKQKKEKNTITDMLKGVLGSLGGGLMSVLGGLGSLVSGGLTAALGGLGLAGILSTALAALGPILITAISAAAIAAIADPELGKKMSDALNSVNRESNQAAQNLLGGRHTNFQKETRREWDNLREDYIEEHGNRFWHNDPKMSDEEYEELGELRDEMNELRKIIESKENMEAQVDRIADLLSKPEEEIGWLTHGGDYKGWKAKMEKKNKEIKENIGHQRTRIKSREKFILENTNLDVDAYLKETENYVSVPGVAKQSGGLIPTLLEPGEKVFMPGFWGSEISSLNSLVPRFQEGGVVEHLHGDPSRDGYDQAGHGTEATAHDHFAFSSSELKNKVRDALKAGSGPSGRKWQIGSENDGAHASGSYHYSDQAFDVPWSQFGSGAIGENDYEQSQQLSADVKAILESLGENPNWSGTGGGSGGSSHGEAANNSRQNQTDNIADGFLRSLGPIGGVISGIGEGLADILGSVDLGALGIGAVNGAKGIGGIGAGLFSGATSGSGSSTNSSGLNLDGVQSGAYSKEALIGAMDSAGITDPEERAMFLAQMHHESGGFRYTHELSGGHDYYGGGKKYHGRGYIQLTHDYNYKKYGDMIGVDLIGNPELAAEPTNAAKIALAYWNDRVDRSAAQTGDVSTVTRNIQGGQAHLAERSELYEKYLGEGLQRGGVVRRQTGGVVNLSGGESAGHERLASAQASFNASMVAVANQEPIIIYEDEPAPSVASDPTTFQDPPTLPDGPSTVQAAEYYYNLSFGGSF